MARLDATWPLNLPVAEYVKLYEDMLNSPDGHHFAIETMEGKHIGNGMVYNLKDDRGELGIMIGDKDYWGQGLGTEAVGLLVAYAFQSLKLRELVLHTLSWNSRAQRCFEKCGFTVSGRRIWGSQTFLRMKLSCAQWQMSIQGLTKPSTAEPLPPSPA